MKRPFAIILPALATLALFGGFVYAVLAAAHLSEPAATTVYGLTPRRLWATLVAVLGLGGVVVGGLALHRAARRTGNDGRRCAIAALVIGTIAVANGGLNLAIASGGPGTGNGVVGGAAAFVLGWITLTLGAVALSRSRRTGLGHGA